MNDILSITEENIKDFVRAVYEELKERNISHIIGVSRGGLMPAIYASYYFDLPLIITNYSDPRGASIHPENEITYYSPKRSMPGKNSNVLLIDNYCESGYTLKMLYENIAQNVNTIYCATLAKSTKCDVSPNFFIRELPKGWTIEFPWEFDLEEKENTIFHTIEDIPTWQS